MPASEATADLAGTAWQAGVRALRRRRHRGPRPRAPPTSRSSAGRWPPAATYLRTLTDAGLDVDRGGRRWWSSGYAATDEQFATIAKLRAARRLWARVLELSGVSTADRRGEMRQHAVTSRPMMSKYDPWVNMLRTTVAAFAAGVGGADASPCSRSTARSAAPTRSAAGSPATPRTC